MLSNNKILPMNDGVEIAMNTIYVQPELSLLQNMNNPPNQTIFREEDNCIICLTEINEHEKIKPCSICNTYLDVECFKTYVISNNYNIKCPTCYEIIGMQKIKELVPMGIGENKIPDTDDDLGISEGVFTLIILVAYVVIGALIVLYLYNII